MSEYTASVSDRHGWEWNRIYGETTERTSSHPRTFDPARYEEGQESSPEVEELQREIEQLEREIERREQYRDEIIQQYERCLAEKNREISEQRHQSGEDHILSTVLDPLLE